MNDYSGNHNLQSSGIAATNDMDNAAFVEAAERHCRFSMCNTGVGAWLVRALERLEKND